MQTIIFCGGSGTRLREETEYRPKPMVNIGKRPILWHIMKIFACYGYQNFILPLGYKGNIIKDYFLRYETMNNDLTLELGRPEAIQMHNCHDEAGWRITLADTGEHTLKGGRLKRVQRYVSGDEFMLTYGDGVADVDINKLLEFHRSHGKIATVTGVRPLARFGELNAQGDRVVSFREKPQIASHDGLINGGFFVFSRAVFDYLTPEDNCDLEHGPLEVIAAAGELKVFRHDGFWYCMDTMRDVDVLNRMWEQGQAEWKIW
ncbi:glucose-1-phosphate cytidylyltransferase [Desulfonatronospira thiodismutans ASO3-1]|uniref:Glucose-1-phosphate cytidylyltransferase n=1 Tax=Desulfonatronospira thiodismutans ASO3-1 TaxID=555779 RepID=D6SN92_9BACT|nr:glucose-1-phosphate cytidylyltransferase [Desulfonatronospira thiodismutans]EFI34218.1 glucose-1-phosphate cytidylyltransferase [Desulfonatronospira thiodismutans ASO3-1]